MRPRQRPGVVDDGEDRRVVGVVRLAIEPAEAHVRDVLEDDPVLPVGAERVFDLMVVAVERERLRSRAVPPTDRERLLALVSCDELDVQPGGRGHLDLDHRSATSCVPHDLP